MSLPSNASRETIRATLTWVLHRRMMEATQNAGPDSENAAEWLAEALLQYNELCGKTVPQNEIPRRLLSAGAIDQEECENFKAIMKECGFLTFSDNKKGSISRAHMGFFKFWVGKIWSKVGGAYSEDLKWKRDLENPGGSGGPGVRA